MASIQYYPGCEPSNPNRPKTQEIQMLRRESVIAVLTELREQLEAAAGTDLAANTIIGFWYILTDLSRMLGLTIEEQRGIMGEYISFIMEEAINETWGIREKGKPVEIR